MADFWKVGSTLEDKQVNAAANISIIEDHSGFEVYTRGLLREMEGKIRQKHTSSSATPRIGLNSKAAIIALLAALQAGTKFVSSDVTRSFENLPM